MDSVTRYNKERYEELTKSGVSWSQPMLDLTKDSAMNLINREKISVDVKGKEVLCLAAGGGQQSAAFGVLGASVTVFDLSESMLEKDVEAAKHYGFPVRVEQGDMRDLSIFADDSFDFVLSLAICCVPDPSPVIKEVSRVLRPSGYLRMEIPNSLWAGVYEKYDQAYQRGELVWEGYAVTEPVVDGEEVKVDDPCSEFEGPDGESLRMLSPKVFHQRLSTILNLLIKHDLRIVGFWEDNLFPEDGQGSDPEPGSWQHFVNMIPTGYSLWARLDAP